MTRVRGQCATHKGQNVWWTYDVPVQGIWVASHNVDVKQLCDVSNDCGQTVEMTTIKARISTRSCHTILSRDVKVHHICQHNVPIMLTHKQYKNHIRTVCTNTARYWCKLSLKGCNRWQNLVFPYDSQSRLQPLASKSPSLLRAMMFQQDHLEGKVMASWQGNMHHEFLTEGAMIYKGRYKDIITHLQEETHLRNPEMRWPNTAWQCSGTLVTVCSAATCQAWYCGAFPSTTLSKSCTMCLFFLFVNEGLADGLSLHGWRGHSCGFEDFGSAIFSILFLSWKSFKLPCISEVCTITSWRNSFFFVVVDFILYI